MSSNIEFLQKLKNVKVVLGNGFDLYCGLRTRYSDYYKWRGKDYRELDKRFTAICNIIYENTNPAYKKPVVSLFPHLIAIKDANVWDLFSILYPREGEGFLWCDIESEMLESLNNADEPGGYSYKPHWEDVLAVLMGDSADNHDAGSFLMASFIRSKEGQIQWTCESFYDYLLEQLKEFEMRFSYFVTTQHLIYRGMIWVENTAYQRNARELFGLLCNPGELVSIDCFNYGFVPDPELNAKCHYVNGNWSNPIFGLDSVFPPDDPRYIFTKTNRRIEWDMNGEVTMDDSEYDNVIVFGHSLNKHDYSYFFPLLDHLEMTNAVSTKKFIVVYNVYDSANAQMIKSDIRKNLYSLFSNYAKYKGFAEENINRLLDSLTTQGRVRTFEVPSARHSTEGYLDEAYDVLPFREEINKSMIESRWNHYLKREGNR